MSELIFDEDGMLYEGPKPPKHPHCRWVLHPIWGMRAKYEIGSLDNLSLIEFRNNEEFQKFFQAPPISQEEIDGCDIDHLIQLLVRIPPKWS